MNGTLLRFYVHENRKHRHIALYEWLLEQAKTLGIHGGSAFRAIAGFGRHGVLHEEHFFELAAEMTIEVEFVVNDDEAAKLIDLLRRERVSIFYARVPAEFGTIEGDGSKGKDVATVAKPGASGAGIGALVAGGKGAAIGSGIGAAVGLATVFATRGKDLEVQRGSTMDIQLDRQLLIPTESDSSIVKNRE